MEKYYSETNLVEDDYDDLDDFIVGSDDEAGEEEVLPEAGEEEDLPEAEEEEVEEEEEEEPPVGVQEILSIREQLKAKYRKQHQSNGASCSPSVQAPARSRFGTFFGPSTPALAPRLIEAGSASIMKDIQNVPSKRDAAPSSSRSQPNASAHEQKPKIVTQVKQKVDTLRENRDYSNLFSDNADTPPPLAKEEPETKPVMSPKTEVEVRGRPMQPAGKNKVRPGQPTRATKDNGSIQGRVQSKASQMKKTLPLSNGTKTNPSVSNGSRPSNVIKKAPGLQPSSNGQNLQRPMQNKRPHASPAVQKKQHQPSQAQRLPQVQRQQNDVPSSSQVRRVNSSVQSQQRPAHKGSALPPQDRRKIIQKRPVPSSKPKPSQAGAVSHAMKKVGVKRKVSQAESIRQMVRDALHYDPAKYVGRDEDDRNMVADFASIEMEERRSAKLASKEDQEQLLMIQEEERRERAKKKKKQPAQS